MLAGLTFKSRSTYNLQLFYVLLDVVVIFVFALVYADHPKPEHATITAFVITNFPRVFFPQMLWGLYS